VKCIITYTPWSIRNGSQLVFCVWGFLHNFPTQGLRIEVTVVGFAHLMCIVYNLYTYCLILIANNNLVLRAVLKYP